MRLISCNIEGFGTLSTREFTFDGGLSAICEENGYGKSTLADFIRAMLYGMPDGRKRAASNPRKRYAPWQGGAFGGSLVFETDKGRFRVTRSFGKKQSDDTFELIDLATRLPSDAYGERLGESLFGLSEESFVKSTYLSEEELSPEMTPDINARLTDLLESSDDMGDYGEATARLDAFVRRLKNAQSHGLIPDRRSELKECLDEIDRLERRSARATECRRELADCEGKLADLRAERARLNDEATRAEKARLAANDIAHSKRLFEDAENAAAELARAEKQFPGGIPSDDELSAATGAAARLNALNGLPHGITERERARLSELRTRLGTSPDGTLADRMLGELQRLSDRRSELESKAREIREPTEPTVARGRGIGIVLLAFGVLVIAVGLVVCLAADALTGLAVALVGLIPGAIGTVLFSFAKRRNALEAEAYRAGCDAADRARADLEREREDLRLAEADFDARLAACAIRDVSDRYAAIGELRRDMSEYSELCRAETEAERSAERVRAELAAPTALLKDFLTRYGGEVSPTAATEAVAEIRRRTDAVVRARATAADKLRCAEEFAAEKGIERDREPVAVPDDAELKAKMQALERKTSDLERLRGSLLSEAEAAERDAEPLAALNDRAEALRGEIAHLEADLVTAQTAKELLTRAKDSLSGRYLTDMERSFDGSFSAVSGLSLGSEIDTSLGLKLGDAKKHPDASYSRGLRAISAICLRLALTDALFGDDLPFLILDDPFRDLDDTRLGGALALLRRFAERYQIIYLTCHSSRMPRPTGNAAPNDK